MTAEVGSASSPRGAIERLLQVRQVRFLLVGGVNTVIGYALYAFLYWLTGHHLAPTLCLLISYILYSPVAFVLFRRFVFDVRGNVLRDYVRFQSVYLVSFGSNLLLLWVLTGPLGWNAYLSQILALVVVTIWSYLAHHSISFRRKPDPA